MLTEVGQCYALSPYLRTDQESKSTTVLQTQEGSLFIPSTLRAQVSSHTRESDKSPEQRSIAAYIQAVLCLSYRSSWRYMIGQAG